MTTWLGVDFGTSNSAAAVVNSRGQPEIIELPDGRKSLPSVVAIVDGQILVGDEALERGKAKRDWMYRHFKRSMGERYHDATASGHQTMEGADGLIAWKGPPSEKSSNGTSYTTVELVSYVIGDLLSAAEAKLGERPTCAVITIPADSGEAQRAATIAAGKLAGLERVELMHEPTAAALAYGFDFAKTRRIVVVDIGGGTADLSCIQTGKGRSDHALVSVIATDGRRKGLGGIDFDRRLASYLANRWRTLYPDKDITADHDAMERVLEASEAAKIRLSGREETSVRVPDLGSKDGVALHLEEVVDLKTFSQVAAELTKSISAICRRLVEKVKEKDPNFSVVDVHDVVLVGGMTRSPIVRDAVRVVFGREPRRDVNPEEAVAFGAAIEAARLSGRKTGLTVTDIISWPISVETTHGVAAMIFPSGAPFGSKRTVVIRNASDDQQALSIAILEGPDPRADQCAILARHDHIISEPGPAKSSALKLVCEIDKGGRFSAEAEDGWGFEGAS